jgi:hypothetical protein
MLILEPFAELLSPEIEQLCSSHGHEDLAAACAGLGLPMPPNDETKRERARARIAAMCDAEMPQLARSVLAHMALPAGTRNAIQGLLWSFDDAIPVSKRTRRELDVSCRSRTSFTSRPVHGRPGKTVVLDDNPFSAVFEGYRTFVATSSDVLRNPGDWSVDELFE